MEEHQALIAFGALSQETRLRLLKLLVVAGREGVAAGTLAETLEVSPSNISFHLKELERAGLITSRRDSRSIIYGASYEALGALVRFLMDDCCSGHPEICGVAPPAQPCCPSTSKTA